MKKLCLSIWALVLLPALSFSDKRKEPIEKPPVVSDGCLDYFERKTKHFDDLGAKVGSDGWKARVEALPSTLPANVSQALVDRLEDALKTDRPESFLSSPPYLTLNERRALALNVLENASKRDFTGPTWVALMEASLRLIDGGFGSYHTFDTLVLRIDETLYREP